MNRIILVVLLLLSSFITHSQTSSISGEVFDEYLEPFPGAIITTSEGKTITSKFDGTFTLNVKLPVTLTASSVGYGKETVEVTRANQKISFVLKETSILDEVVISASRTPERVLESPVSIERIDYRNIKKSPAFNFYNSLNNLKGVDINENSFNLKVLNTRGFSDLENVRFVQMVDGADIVIPSSGASVGNSGGLNELDVLNIEILPGAASALYGANAFNGVLLMTSKNPFDYQGISTYLKTGITSQKEAGENPFYDVGLRMAHAFNNKFAAKVNLTYIEGEEWHAHDTRNSSGVGGMVIEGNQQTPGYDGVNFYGDEVRFNLKDVARLASIPSPLNPPTPEQTQLLGLLKFIPDTFVSRKGYQEDALVDNQFNHLMFDASLYYRPMGDDKLEISWLSKYGLGDNIFQGSNRYAQKNTLGQQHKLEFKGRDFTVRGYYTTYDVGNSYDTRLTAMAINNEWKSNRLWIEEYLGKFAYALGGALRNGTYSPEVLQQILTQTSNSVDANQPKQGSEEFNRLFEKYKNTPIKQGGGKLNNTTEMYHADANLNLRNIINWGEIQVGGSFRKYILNSQGQVYVAEGIDYDEFGLYTQLQKKLLNDRLKFTGSVRYDKSQNFEGNFSPRVSFTYAVGKNRNHTFRTSFQTAFRNPTSQDLYNGLTVAGNTTVLGTSKESFDLFEGVYYPSVDAVNFGFVDAEKILKGNDILNNSYTLESVVNFTETAEPLIDADPTRVQDILQENKGLLKKAEVSYIKPEQIKSFELGYRGVLNIGKTIIETDISGYYSSYKNLLTTRRVAVPLYYGQNPYITNQVLEPYAFAIRDYATIVLRTNTEEKVNSYGVSAGFNTKLNDFTLGLNYTWAKFDSNNVDLSFKPAFNTPEHNVKLQIGKENIFRNFGAGVNVRWQDEFLWQSNFLDGYIDARTVLDAQLNYRIPSWKSRIKLGGTNLTGKEYFSAPGLGAIGSTYYISWVIND